MDVYETASRLDKEVKSAAKDSKAPAPPRDTLYLFLRPSQCEEVDIGFAVK